MGPMPDGRCLIIPDIHEEYGHLRALLERYEAEADRVIWLGDFLDSFSGYTRQTVDTVEWLRDHVENPKYTFLWGNHDLHYAWPIGDLICSGYDPRKQLLVNDRLRGIWESRFHLHAWVNGWLCTHAGVHKFTLGKFATTADGLSFLESNAMQNLRQSRATPVVRAGRGRGGPQPFGGWTWLDWDREFSPIEGVNQIVGHTPGEAVRIREGEHSRNYCIDVDNASVAMMVDESGAERVVESITKPAPE